MNSSLFYLSPFFFQSNQSGGQEGSGDGEGENEQNNGDNQQNNQGDPVSFASFDEFYKSLTDDQKKVVDPARSHFERMQNTVRDTRQERDEFSSQLKELRKQLEGNADAQAKIDTLSANLDEANRKADFYEQAPAQECRNVKAAYALAKASNLFVTNSRTKEIVPDWKAIKEQAPELFGQKVVKRSNAGSGTDTKPTPAGGINDWIRSEAGITPQ